jgi:hypothetical protein
VAFTKEKNIGVIGSRSCHRVFYHNVCAQFMLWLIGCDEAPIELVDWSSMFRSNTFSQSAHLLFHVHYVLGYIFAYKKSWS